MMALLNYWFSQNFTMTVIIIVGGFFVLLALLLVLQLLLFTVDKLIPKAKLSMSLRFAWQQLNRCSLYTSDAADE